jgi:hypothetical protein
MILGQAMQSRSQPNQWLCSFCRRPGVRSKEHVLARWLQTHADDLPMTRTKQFTGFDLNASANAYINLPTGRVVSQNSLLHQKTRAICKKCNEGWMGSLEAPTIPIMGRLIRATRDRRPTVISREDATTLARWAVKTAWTTELASIGDQNQDDAWPSPEMRLALMTGDGPGVESWVWLAACPELEQWQQLQAHVQFDRTSPPTPGERPRRLLSTCLIIAGVALLVYNFDHRTAFPPPLRPLHGLRLWPHPTKVEFPPIPTPYAGLYNAVATYGDWLPLHRLPFDQTEVG